MPKYFEDCDDFGCAVQGCSEGCEHKPPDCILTLPLSFTDSDGEVFERFYSPLSGNEHFLAYTNTTTGQNYTKYYCPTAEDCANNWLSEFMEGINKGKIKELNY